MKAKELMICDIVKTYRAYEIVSDIYTNSIFTKDGLWEGEEFKDGEFEPIPLTPEILEKNRFKELTKRVKHFIWMLKVEDILVEAIEITSNVFQITIHQELSDLSDERVNIRYVHELQHAMRLCGLNEFADNFKI